MGFINDLGAAPGEYSSEASEVCLNAKREMNDDQLADLVFNTFIDSVELNPSSFENECKTRAPYIRKILFDKNG